MPAGLEKSHTRQSVASAILTSNANANVLQKTQRTEKIPSIVYLLYRLAKINHDPSFRSTCPSHRIHLFWCSLSLLFDLVRSCLAELFALHAIGGGPCPEPTKGIMLHDANKWALYFFVIAILCTLAISIQTYTLMKASSVLMERIRRMSLFAYLRADVSYHDEDAHSSGALSNSLADNSQKINGLVGVTLEPSFRVFDARDWCHHRLGQWLEVVVVVIACIPLTLSAGFVRLQRWC